jgi:DNA modification methylase
VLHPRQQPRELANSRTPEEQTVGNPHGRRRKTRGTYSTILGSLIEDYNGADPIPVSFRKIVGEARTRDRLTHLCHPYPAKLIPHIPLFFLNSLPLTKSSKILDPFCGSGTVVLEAVSGGHIAIGADVNPLARLLTKVKTTPTCPRALQRALARVLSASSNVSPDKALARVSMYFPNVHYWFEPRISAGLAGIQTAISRLKSQHNRDFLQVCLSATARALSNADPRIAVPVRQRTERFPSGHWLEKQSQIRLHQLTIANVAETFAAIARLNIDRMGAFLQGTRGSKLHKPILYNDARDLYSENLRRRQRAGSVDLIITSPPYLGAQKYIRASSLSLMWLGCEGYDELMTYHAQSIGREHLCKPEIELSHSHKLNRNIEKILTPIFEKNPMRAAITREYLREMSMAFAEMARVIKDDAHMVLVMGNNIVAGITVETDTIIQEIAYEYGFLPLLKLVDTIPSRGLMTRRNRTSALIPFEIVTLFQKRGR